MNADSWMILPNAVTIDQNYNVWQLLASKKQYCTDATSIFGLPFREQLKDLLDTTVLGSLEDNGRGD